VRDDLGRANALHHAAGTWTSPPAVAHCPGRSFARSRRRDRNVGPLCARGRGSRFPGRGRWTQLARVRQVHDSARAETTPGKLAGGVLRPAVRDRAGSSHGSRSHRHGHELAPRCRRVRPNRVRRSDCGRRAGGAVRRCPGRQPEPHHGVGSRGFRTALQRGAVGIRALGGPGPGWRSRAERS